VLSCKLWLDFLQATNEADQLKTVTQLKAMAEKSLDGTDFDRGWLLAWDQLGAMYQKLNRHSDALAAFTRSLQLHPNRFRGLVGAAQNAFLSGNYTLGASLYRQLLSLCHPDGLKTGAAPSGPSATSCGQDRIKIYRRLQELYSASPAGGRDSSSACGEDKLMVVAIMVGVVAVVGVIGSVFIVYWWYRRSSLYAKLRSVREVANDRMAVVL